MLRYGFFDSEITGYDMEGMPIFDRGESSDFLAMFISNIISDGVMALPGDCFQVVANEGMKLKVRPGFGIVRGRFAMDTQECELTLQKAPASYKRIDRVVLRANYLDRLCEITIKEGTPAMAPAPPDLLQPASGDYYELCLATVAVNSNQTVVTQANITDTRYDSRVCGVVTQVIDHLDTSTFFTQLEQFYQEFVARSDGSYDKFVADMAGYLDRLEESGDGQLKEIVDTLVAFEAGAEESYLEWLQGLKDKLSGDIAGKLQLQIDDLINGETPIEYEEPEEYVAPESGIGIPKFFGRVAKGLRTLFDAIGVLAELKTVDKHTLVAAVNELATGKVDIASVIASTNITEPGYVMDGATCSDALAQLNGDLNGMPKFECGLRTIQTSSNDSVEELIQFPHPFEKAPVVVVSVDIPYKTFGMAYVAVERNSISKTGFKMVFKPANYAASATWSVEWMAIQK